MKKTSLLKRLSLAGIILFAINYSAVAGVDPPVVLSLMGNLNQMAVDSSVMVQDDKFFDPSFNSILIKPYLVRNVISLKIDENSPYFIQTNFTATVTVR